MRIVTTCSWAVVVSGGPLVGALAGAFIGALFASPSSHPDVAIRWSLIGALIMLAPQVWVEYKRKTYDPTLIFNFDERFNRNEMKIIRKKASKILLEHLGHMGEDNRAYADVDDILDFLEDLGFYHHGHQISTEVAHHAFYEMDQRIFFCI
jgi:hypothetical protein